MIRMGQSIGQKRVKVKSISNSDPYEGMEFWRKNGGKIREKSGNG